MRTRYIQHPQTGELIPASQYRQTSRSHFVKPDAEGYQCPITGKWIEGRRQHRNNLARHNCLEYDPELKKDQIRNERESIRRHERSIDEAVERAAAQMRW